MSCLEHPLIRGAPRSHAPPFSFGLILLALNLKVMSKVGLFSAARISGNERCLGWVGDRAVGIESCAGLGFGGGQVGAGRAAGLGSTLKGPRVEQAYCS